MNKLKELPISCTSFADIRNNNMIYVDKTDMIATIARANRNKAFFLGRPRRFGKTLLVNTFEDLFTNGLKNFKGLKIDTQNLWTDTKTYPVLHLDFSDFKTSQNIDQFKYQFNQALLEFTKEQNINIDSDTPEPNIIARRIFKNFKERELVLLIDEYDSALNAAMLNSELFEGIRNIYSNFVSTIKTYEGKFRFIFITGITRYTHASIFSPFNIVYDLSLDTRYQTLLGYTDEELETYFGDYLEESAKVLNLSIEELHQKLKEYYDGYHFNPDLKSNLYCPFSILNFFNYPENGFANYWNESGAGTDVVNRYFKKNPVSCSEVLEGIEITTREYLQGSSISSMNYAVLLQQAGYYTFAKSSSFRKYNFKVPNKEVASTIYPLVFENDTKLGSRVFDNIVDISDTLVQNLFEGKEEEANTNFNKILDIYGYDAINSLMISESVLRDNLMLIFTLAMNMQDNNIAYSYNVSREEINQKGRADLIIDLSSKPEAVKENQIVRVVIELKIAEGEEHSQQKLEEAIEQIKTRDYGNNGYINPKNIKRYAVVFYKDTESTKKFGVILKQS